MRNPKFKVQRESFCRAAAKMCVCVCVCVRECVRACVRACATNFGLWNQILGILINPALSSGGPPPGILIGLPDVAPPAPPGPLPPKAGGPPPFDPAPPPAAPNCICFFPRISKGQEHEPYSTQRAGANGGLYFYTVQRLKFSSGGVLVYLHAIVLGGRAATIADDSLQLEVVAVRTRLSHPSCHL